MPMPAMPVTPKESKDPIRCALEAVFERHNARSHGGGDVRLEYVTVARDRPVSTQQEMEEATIAALLHELAEAAWAAVGRAAVSGGFTEGWRGR